MPQPRRRAEPADPDPLQPDPSVEGSSEPSSTVSPVADWIGDPGPEFDAGESERAAGERSDERAAAASISPGGAAGLEIEWHQDTVRSMLSAQGSALHAVAGKAQEDWIYTKTELDSIAPALTRILNRYDALRLAAGTGDEFALAIGLTGYSLRSLAERKAALAEIKAREEAAAEAVAGAPEGGWAPPIPEPGEDVLP